VRFFFDLVIRAEASQARSISLMIARCDNPAPLGPGRILPWTLVAMITSSKVLQRPPEDLLARAVFGGAESRGLERVSGAG
jgi:hypothetical protein